MGLTVSSFGLPSSSYSVETHAKLVTHQMTLFTINVTNFSSELPSISYPVAKDATLSMHQTPDNQQAHGAEAQ
jgi:hypothetical protein